MIPGHVALAVWPLITIILFAKMPLKNALVWSIVSGYLLLPSWLEIFWNLPLMPTIDKRILPSIAAGLCAIFILRRFEAEKARPTRAQPMADIGPVMPGWLPRTLLGNALLAALFGGIFVTALTNGDPLTYGPLTLPGLRLYDAVSVTVEVVFPVFLLLVGRKFLSDADGHRILLFVLVIAALGYSLLALYEVRMSPQINSIVYGFFPHSWFQHIRGGGFRPLVFLDHGLLLGIFLACAVLATAILYRTDPDRRVLYLFALPWLAFTLVVSKTLGALLIAIVMLPVAWFMPKRLQLLAAAVIAGTALFYPTLRGAGVIPTESIVETAASISNERRASSLEFRFNQEDMLLERANLRPFFGWGGWSRARVFDETGRDLSTTDGSWVILIGESGWVGYIGRFGLLAIPVMLLALRQRRYHVDMTTAGLCLVMAANLIDMLPNSSETAITWLVAGALLGRLEPAAIKLAQAQQQQHSGRAAPRGKIDAAETPERPELVPDPQLAETSRYTRFATDKRRTS